MTIEDVMESVCGRCHCPLEAEGQEELDELCGDCTIAEEIEALVREKGTETSLIFARAMADSLRDVLDGAGKHA